MTPPPPDQGGPGPRNDLTDIPGVLVGHAEDAMARTGATAILFEKPAIIAGDVRGGGPGARETDLLDPSTLVETADAVILSGGSSYGLGAADGAAAWLGARGRGFRLTPQEGVPPSPIVPAAILYDLANGGDKNWSARGDGRPPYYALGEQACAHATSAPIGLGRAGAGFGALAGASPGGVGSASFITADGLRVAALIAVNSFGSVKTPGEDVFWAWPYEWNGEFGGARPSGDAPPAAGLPDDTKLGPLTRGSNARGAAGPTASPTNTTIGLVAVDASRAADALSQAQMQRVAVMAQDGLARAIRPIHGPTDGDILFAAAISAVRENTAAKAGKGAQKAATNNCAGENNPRLDALTLTRIGSVAADVVARAVARAVFEAEKQLAAGTSNA